MAKVNHNITQNQYIYLLQSSMIGLGVLAIGSGVATGAHQSAWIPVLLMGIYPIFLVLCSSYIDKKTGHIQYWEMSMKVYGKILTYLFTFVFLIDFLLTAVFALSGFTNVLLITLTSYLPAKLTLMLTLLLSVFIALDGLTYIGRLVELLFFLLVILILVPVTFYHGGNIINVQPFFDSLQGIVSVLPSCIYPYTGIEIIFLLLLLL
jgi:spore germination protein